MSVSGPLSGITFSGLASGINTQSIITKLVAIDQIPITNLQTQETSIQTQQSAIQQLQTGVVAIQTAASALAQSSTFSAVAGLSSDTSVATVTSGIGAQPGVFNLTVTQLATAQKLASLAQTDTTSALNQTGTFLIDGKSVSVASSDTLTTLAQKINGAGAGVTASIINGGAGNAYLTLTSSSTGLANAVSLTDTTGSVMQNLGFTSGAPVLNTNTAGDAISANFANGTNALSALKGYDQTSVGSFTVNGANVSVNFSTDSLQAIAQKINAATSTVNATVKQNTNGQSYLDIAGTSGTPTLVDTNGTLAALGVYKQSSPKNQLIAAQDASYSLDGVNLTSSTNTITTAIPGSTLQLLKGTPTTPATSTLSFSTDTTGIDAKVQAFASAYNSVVDYISANSQLDPKTYTTGVLFGDFTTQQVSSTLSNMLFTNVPGLTGNYQNISSLGLSLDSNNHIVVDTTALNTALNANPTAVSNVFGSSGTSTNPNLTFVTNGANSVSSPNPYAVNITQAATQGVGTIPSSFNYATSSTLAFSSAQIGAAPYQLLVNANSTPASLAAQINGDTTLSNEFTASVDSSNNVLLTSKAYGSKSTFTVTNTIGSSAGSTINVVNGLDVAGTINGESATGTGQFLSGNTGNATTDGLQLRYSGTTTGNVGGITYSKGIAGQIADSVTQMTNSTNGLFTATNQSFTNQINDINGQITSLQTLVSAQQAYLTTEFNNMEAVIAQLQQQGSQLSAVLGSASSSSTGSASSATVNTSGH